jgi:cell division protein FtsZ
MGILTVAVVTKPFPFEGKKRLMIAEEGIDNLAQVVDSLITIPNARLLNVLGKGISLLDAFKAANDVLLGAVQGISELITRPGLINVDFADVKTVMSEMGVAMMGTGIARGENRAKIAAESAISSPLLDDINLSGAKGVLVNITAGMDLSISEFEEVGASIKDFTSDNATVIIGTVIDENMSDDLRVTLVATGLGKVSSATTKDKQAERVAPNFAARKQEFGKFNQRALAAKRTSGITQLDSKEKNQHNMDYLDIPAFLRRQSSQEES